MMVQAECVQMEALCEQIVPILLLILLAASLWISNWSPSDFATARDKVQSSQSRDDLIYDMRVVRSTRFSFSKRREIKSRTKAFVINALSVISIFVNVYLLANASGVTELELKRISIAIIGLSLLALWMSLDTPPSELLRRATDAHKCAREVSEICRALNYKKIDPSDAAELYEAIISKYPENHDPIDRKNALYADKTKNPQKQMGYQN